MPSLATATEAPARGAGSFRSVDSVQVVILPVATSGVAGEDGVGRLAIGAEAADDIRGAREEDRRRLGARSRQRGTLAPGIDVAVRPDDRGEDARLRRPGRIGAADQQRLEAGSHDRRVGARERQRQLDRVWAPRAGIVPAGAGQGTVSFDAGQKLMGVTSRAGLKTLSATPRSIVFCTVA